MTAESKLETRALRYLTRREYSRPELEAKLSIRCSDLNRETLSIVLEKLERQGYLSAQRMVEQIIQRRRNKFGSQRIVMELKEKGIAENLINAALPELKETELDAGYHVWQKKFNTLPDDMKERGKQIRFLMSRGFSYEMIHQILSHADREKR